MSQGLNIRQEKKSGIRKMIEDPDWKYSSQKEIENKFNQIYNEKKQVENPENGINKDEKNEQKQFTFYRPVSANSKLSPTDSVPKKKQIKKPYLNLSQVQQTYDKKPLYIQGSTTPINEPESKSSSAKLSQRPVQVKSKGNQFQQFQYLNSQFLNYIGQPEIENKNNDSKNSNLEEKQRKKSMSFKGQIVSQNGLVFKQQQQSQRGQQQLSSKNYASQQQYKSYRNISNGKQQQDSQNIKPQFLSKNGEQSRVQFDQMNKMIEARNKLYYNDQNDRIVSNKLDNSGIQGYLNNNFQSSNQNIQSQNSYVPKNAKLRVAQRVATPKSSKILQKIESPMGKKNISYNNLERKHNNRTIFHRKTQSQRDLSPSQSNVSQDISAIKQNRTKKQLSQYSSQNNLANKGYISQQQEYGARNTKSQHESVLRSNQSQRSFSNKNLQQNNSNVIKNRYSVQNLNGKIQENVNKSQSQQVSKYFDQNQDQKKEKIWQQYDEIYKQTIENLEKKVQQKKKQLQSLNNNISNNNNEVNAKNNIITAQPQSRDKIMSQHQQLNSELPQQRINQSLSPKKSAQNSAPVQQVVNNLAAYNKPLDSNQYTLVLDLDETLVHLQQNYYNPKNDTYKLLLRPYAKDFVNQLGQICQLVVFTAATVEYAEKVVSILDPQCKSVKKILTREDLTFLNPNSNVYYKDLTKINTNLNKTILIDNDERNFYKQPMNGYKIRTWTGEKNDNDLVQLCKKLSIIINEKKDIKDFVNRQK